jgi:hypothetical protein
MKNILIATLFASLLAGFWSCSNELDVTDDWKEVPVIYGLLDPQDSVHIIKVTKAFLGDGNALLMAKIPDSSFYGGELVVELIEIAPEGWTTRTWVLDTMWVNNKQPGDFFSGDQLLYKVNADISAINKYMLVVNNTKTKHFASATTSLVRPINITKPRGGQRFFSFTSIAETQTELQASANGRVFQMLIRFHYKEVSFNNPLDTAHRYIDWIFPNKKASNLTGTDKIAYSFSGSGFYTNIAAKLKEDQNLKRIPGNVEFIAFAGGDELSTYIDITSNFNTIVQERPEYSNVKNGIGIFSSRTSASRTCELTPASVDSLVNGSKTFHLGFIFPGP